MLNKHTILFLLAVIGLAACTTPSGVPAEFKKQGLITDKAMVVSAHPLATQVGVDILKKGGNAVDAMVGVHFALAVTLPAAGNLGGGGFMVYRDKDGEAHTLDFREMAPSEAHRGLYLDSTGNVIDSMSYYGHMASGVPGSVAGMWAAHDSLGKLTWEEVVAPSVRLAKEGFLLTEKEAAYINKKHTFLKRYNTRPNIFLTKNEWSTNDSIAHGDLAKTLASIKESGPAGFYEGWVADSIVAEMGRGGGIISHADLKNYKAIWRKPLIGDFQEYEVISMGPPSSGGIALLQMLGMVENQPLETYGWHSSDATHYMTEVERRVFADRASHLGDPDYYNVPVSGLLDKVYLKKRMSNFYPTAASSSTKIGAGTPAPKESEETTHYSIVDAEGNAVSVTTTLNGGFGSYVVVGGAGFLLNNEMDDFAIKPGYPNAYGLLGAEANAVEAGKRMLSSMTPTIVTRGDSLFMVVGTPGGSTIMTSVFQTILNVTQHDMSMQGAVNAPRFHHQWLPDTLYYEEGAFSVQALKTIKRIGHARKERDPIGRVDAILVLPDGKLEGGADPRGDDVAGGF
ncbi:MAG: gamma-glutamyltransferase [Bacteroidia bacterium]